MFKTGIHGGKIANSLRHHTREINALIQEAKSHDIYVDFDLVRPELKSGVIKLYVYVSEEL